MGRLVNLARRLARASTRWASLIGWRARAASGANQFSALWGRSSGGGELARAHLAAPLAGRLAGRLAARLAVRLCDCLRGCLSEFAGLGFFGPSPPRAAGISITGALESLVWFGLVQFAGWQ